MKEKSKINLLFILIAIVILIVGIVATFLTQHIEEREYRDLQLEAAELMAEAESAIKAKMLEEGVEIDFEDVNETGLMGPEFTELTTTPGNPDAKRTSLNPNFAAAMIRYYKEAGLKKGDNIAVGSSGSFPGLLIATLTAAKVYGLNVKLICSLGSSMHGATRPEFNIFDYIQVLFDGGYSDAELLAVSPGGVNDQGGATLEGVIFFGTKELALELCKKVGVEVITIEDLAENIQYRLKLYGDDIKLFVNVGGASVNNGASSYTLDFPNGLTIEPPMIPSTPYRGLIYEYAARGVPVINMLNVRGLAEENGIAFDPKPLEKPGESGVYYEIRIKAWIPVLTFIIAISVLVGGFIYGKKKEKKHNS